MEELLLATPTPYPYSSLTSLKCPTTPRPRGYKPRATFDGRHVVVPLFFPSDCSTIGESDADDVKMNDDPDPIRNRPAADFTIKSRRCIPEAPTRKIAIQDFPALPFSFPDPETMPSKPSVAAIPRSSSDPMKLPPFQRRGSISRVGPLRASFSARCA